MGTMLGCFVLLVCCQLMGVTVWAVWLFHFKDGGTLFRETDLLARCLEASGDDWRELWEGRLDWPSFEERFRTRLAVEEGRPVPFKERWFHDLVASGVELWGMVSGCDGERGRKRRRLMVRCLSGA